MSANALYERTLRSNRTPPPPYHAAHVRARHRRHRTPAAGSRPQAGLEYVRLCLAPGAAINAVLPGMYHTALHLAGFSGKSDVIEYLLQHGADPDGCSCWGHPLLDAVCRRELDIVRTLLQHGVDIAKLWNADVDLMGCACARGPRAIVEVLLDACDGLGMSGGVLGDGGHLRSAVDHGQVDVVKLLLERGAEVDARIGIEQETVLYRAVKAGDYEVVEGLLEGGADPAVVCGGKRIMTCAVQCGADMWSRGRIVTPLRRAGLISSSWPRDLVVESFREGEDRMMADFR